MSSKIACYFDFIFLPTMTCWSQHPDVLLCSWNEMTGLARTFDSLLSFQWTHTFLKQIYYRIWWIINLTFQSKVTSLVELLCYFRWHFHCEVHLLESGPWTLYQILCLDSELIHLWILLSIHALSTNSYLHTRNSKHNPTLTSTQSVWKVTINYARPVMIWMRSWY